MNLSKIKRAVQRFTKYRLQKIHLDWLIGILSIPVLITAIILNYTNLTKKPATSMPTASPSPQVIIVPQSSSPVPQISSSGSCQKTVGPISITSPQEGDSISDNPVCITIQYSDPSFCSVVWSYRINGGTWSDFGNSSPCLYNLPNGQVQFNLRVNSTVSSDQKTLTRTFTYTGSGTTPTPTTASSSAH